MAYDSEDGKDAWKQYRRIIESMDPVVQDRLHEFGSRQFSYGYADGLNAAREAVEALSDKWVDQDTVKDALAAIDALRGES